MRECDVGGGVGQVQVQGRASRAAQAAQALCRGTNSCGGIEGLPPLCSSP